jgi:hypothetical protein
MTSPKGGAEGGIAGWDSAHAWRPWGETTEMPGAVWGPASKGTPVGAFHTEMGGVYRPDAVRVGITDG